MGTPAFSLKWLVAGLMSAAVMSALPGVAQTKDPSQGKRQANGEVRMLDGMHAAEKARALQSLERSRRAGNRGAGLRGQQDSAGERSSAAAAPAEPQLLLMERRRVKGASERLADAWYYDYSSNETIHKIIDLGSGVVRSSEVVVDLQLPLIEDEIARAFDVLLTSPSDRNALSRAFRAVTGEAFEDRAQVNYKAFVFHPDTVVDGLTRGARRCGIHRCAQMLIYTHDNIALDMSPVVDLSTGRVLQNLELRAQEIVRREEAAL